MLTTKKVKFIDKKKFDKVTLDENSETFVVHIVALNVESSMLINFSMIGQVVSPQANKATTKITTEYSKYTYIFLTDLAMKLSKYTEINNYAIKLKDGKQLLYSLIYSLKLVELKILKTYIKIYLRTGFIQSSKSFASALILSDHQEIPC